MKRVFFYFLSFLVLILTVSVGASSLTVLYLNIDGNARVLHAVGEVLIQRFGGTPLTVVSEGGSGEDMEAVLRLSAGVPLNTPALKGHGPMIVFQGSGEFGYTDPDTGFFITSERALGTVGFRWAEDPGDVFDSPEVSLRPQFIVIGPSNPETFDGFIYPQILMTVDSEGIRLYSSDTSYHSDFDKHTLPSVLIGSDGTIYAKKFVEQ
jgi:hypothetical protein